MLFRLIVFILLLFKNIFCVLTSNLLYILIKIKSEKSTFVFKSPENQKTKTMQTKMTIRNKIQRILRVLK